MAYTNVNIHTEFSQITQWRLERTKLEAELMFYKTLYRDMCKSFENIPRAIEQYGHIDFSVDGEEKIRLILAPIETKAQQ